MNATTTHRLAALRADTEAHEAAVTNDDPALFLVDLHTGMIDAIAGRIGLVEVAEWLTTPGTQHRLRRWLGTSDVAERIALELLVHTLHEALR